MTNEEILKKSIAKVVKNGFNSKSNMLVVCMEHGVSMRDNIHYLLIFSHDFAKAFWGTERICVECGNRLIIKEVDKNAFVPKGIKYTGTCENDCIGDNGYFFECETYEEDTSCKNAAFFYHLGVMVKTEEPLKYLERFL